MNIDGDFFIGLFWGMLLAVPLWMSVFGWIKIIIWLI